MPHTSTALSAAQAVIDAPAALRAVEAALRHAAQLGARVNVAVVDAAGLPVAFARMAGAPLHSVEIATDKAYTAASFGLPTSAWPAALGAHSEAVRQGLVLRPRFVAFGGGLPIEEDGARIGGIGVSGGSEAQDEAIAHAGLRALGITTDESP
ncbi:GlcG/HbpS family heme-binding protein [Xylophilus sp. ASV27]|uniref:GlcG/HbpS family heme-binding protein n=1 Tax=Xylophilus sp. ASV27 TaxID=2795129 RepID=UPI001E38111E|nr:heme-binding protein [Xylophilus sp. ASV27]